MSMERRVRIAAGLAFAVLSLALLPMAHAQASATRYLGSITAITNDTLTVKTDQGDLREVQVPSTAQIKRIAPGQTDLSKAETIEFSGLATGDRVLVNIDPPANGATPQALRVISIKQADVAKKQQAETEAWAQGVHGLVKSIDAGAGTIIVNTRAGAVTKTVTVSTTSSTSLKRYASGSISFNQAKPAPISAIQSGDQIFVLGAKSADGDSIAAESIVSGSFRSIAGTIISTDAAGTATVKDLATKKPVTVHIGADAQLKRLDDRIATFVAARLKGIQNGAGGAGAGAGGQRNFSQSGGGNGQRNPGGGGDLESILQRAGTIQLASLQKGEAVMIVATEDSTGVNVIKLLAGVEPILEAPEAKDLLASWSLNQGAPDAGQ